MPATTPTTEATAAQTPVIILIDASSDSLTVSWPETAAGAPYTLQYRRDSNRNRSTTDTDDDGGGSNNKHSSSAFETLSTTLMTPQVRKRNLEGNDGFLFRVTSTNNSTSGGGGSNDQIDDDPTTTAWTTHSEPFRLLTRDEEQQRLAAPTVTLGGSISSLRIAWTDETTAVAQESPTRCYEVQMREAKPGGPWTTILASGGGVGRQVRKKNLISPLGYQFRVRVVHEQLEQEPHGGPPFSPPSATMVALGFSPGLQRWFQHCKTLVRPGSGPSTSTSTSSPHTQAAAATTTIAVADALGGKEFVLLYASAHWCGPCRQFTPRLVQWYQQQQQQPHGGVVEVVFLSADHDENGFKSYFRGSAMPWWAVHYDDNDTREKLLAQLRVTGIPRLVVLDGWTGAIVVDNAVGQPLDVTQWRRLLQTSKK